VTFLQKMFELNQSWDLLTKADECEDPDLKLLFVTTFVISTFGSTGFRTSKYLNPYLGETYEYIDDDIKFVAEQISTTPPTSVCRLESKNFILEQSQHVNTVIGANILDVYPHNKTVVTLKSRNDVYTYEGVKTVVHNLIIGKTWVDNVGVITVRNVGTDLSSTIDFKECGWFSKNYHEIESYILENNNRIFSLQGRWDEKITAKRLRSYGEYNPVKENKDYEFIQGNNKLIWENPVELVNEEPYKKYGFTLNTMKAISIQPEMVGTVPRSDSRFRQDRMVLERGDKNRATTNRSNLETIEKRKKTFRQDNGLEYLPKYFEMKEIDGFPYWNYNGQYDVDRETVPNQDLPAIDDYFLVDNIDMQ